MTRERIKNQVSVPVTTDAMVWAHEWCRIAREIEQSDDDRQVIDEGWMVSWFASAIAAGEKFSLDA